MQKKNKSPFISFVKQNAVLSSHLPSFYSDHVHLLKSVFPQVQSGSRKWMLCKVKKVPGWWKRPWAVGRRHWVMPCGAAPTFTVTSSFASCSRDSWSSPAGMNHTGATQQKTDRLAPRPMTWKKLVSLMLVLLFNKNVRSCLHDHVLTKNYRFFPLHFQKHSAITKTVWQRCVLTQIHTDYWKAAASMPGQ